jgi:mycofactocin precursor
MQVGLTEGHVDTMSSTPGIEAASPGADEPAVLEEIEVEELAVDGICGVY